MDSLRCFVHISLIILLNSPCIDGLAKDCKCSGSIRMINSVRNILLKDMLELKLQNDMLTARIETMEQMLQERSTPSVSFVTQGTSRAQVVGTTISDLEPDIKQAVKASNDAVRLSRSIAKAMQSEKKERLQTESILKDAFNNLNESFSNFTVRTDVAFARHVKTMTENVTSFEQYVSDAVTGVKTEYKNTSNEMQKLVSGAIAANLTDLKSRLDVINQDVSRLNIDTDSVIDIALFGQNAVCDPNCTNGGVCFKDNTCRCKHLTEGTQCENFVCDTNCPLNGGECIAPGECKCPQGKYGPNCEHRNTCSSDKFACKTGGCIHAGYRCDGDNDCGDMSDEENCGGNTCPSNGFACKTGGCIPASWVCDGDNDCGDDEDEENC